jgi:hypothetical protein
MITNTGHFNLFPILEFACNHPVMPSHQDRELQKEYTNLLKELVKDVPQRPGWYLWGHFNDMGWWETIYLGKAGMQKTSSLHTRLYGELRDEGVIAFWAQVYGREPVVKQLAKLRDGKWEPSRSLRKSGSQVVVWVAAEDPITEDEIRRQEDHLIKLYRPTHNSARWNQYATHDKLTEYVEMAIENELKAFISPV